MKSITKIIVCIGVIMQSAFVLSRIEVGSARASRAVGGPVSVNKDFSLADRQEVERSLSGIKNYFAKTPLQRTEQNVREVFQQLKTLATVLRGDLERERAMQHRAPHMAQPQISNRSNNQSPRNENKPTDSAVALGNIRTIKSHFSMPKQQRAANIQKVSAAAHGVQAALTTDKNRLVSNE